MWQCEQLLVQLEAEAPAEGGSPSPAEPCSVVVKIPVLLVTDGGENTRFHKRAALAAETEAATDFLRFRLRGNTGAAGPAATEGGGLCLRQTAKGISASPGGRRQSPGPVLATTGGLTRTGSPPGSFRLAAAGVRCELAGAARPRIGGARRVRASGAGPRARLGARGGGARSGCSASPGAGPGPSPFPCPAPCARHRESPAVRAPGCRVVLPCSVQEYQVGQLYSVAEASKNETGGGEGIQVLKNEPYEQDGEKGQYTHKIYHLKSKVPGFVRMIAPEGSLVFHEKAWNAYPYCRTIVTNEYMKDDFFIKIETWHKPDLGTTENVRNLYPNTWKSVEVVHIDIADRTQVEPGDYKADEDPALFQSVKTKRGPLGPNWKKELATDEECPKMCAYKLVTIKFKWWGLQNKVENFIQKQEKRIFTNFHRQLFCWIDKWIELTMEDIRRMEDETQKELEALRNQGQVRGTSAANDE
ncbi:phosphatidylinositol transfer protein beta isoform [Passer montanus]|uniref:phosphatidylinositol transfer protein beta isoform n=1 Tax=Passer montanus TaxID=9160 RepID=UPI001960CDF8|nr:phosphatidylinositol transfer protein beta isoform [Passer montanus]